MNYSIKTDRVSTAETIYSESFEQTVDIDLKLPDYCPDISKILKCRLEPQITGRTVMGDRVNVEGMSLVRVIYVDSLNGAVRCAEQSCPFEVNATISGASQNAAVLTAVRVNYLNCRALSPRRLSVHGTFNIDLKVIDRSDSHLCTHVKGADVQQKKQPVSYYALKSIAQQPFSVTETIETGADSLSVQSVIRSDVSIASKEQSVVSGKLMYKGELLVRLLYLSDPDSNRPDTLEYSIPFSQVITIDPPGDNDKHILRTELINSSVTLRNEIGFDDPLPIISAKLCVTVLTYEKCETTVVTDCYSTSYRMTPQYGKALLPTLNSVINESVVEKSNVDFPESSVSRVFDVWCEKGGIVCERSNGKALIRGKYNICVLAKDADDNVIYAERPFDYSRSVSDVEDNDEIEAYVSAECLSVGYRITGDHSLEARVELLVSGELYTLHSVNTVVSADADENAPTKQRDSASIILYYASKGEDIWDIAREYSASASEVREENDLSDDILGDDMMLMLPIRKA